MSTLVLIVLFSGPTAVTAQTGVVGYGVKAWSDHEDLSELSGAGASIRLYPVPVALGIDLSQGTLHRTGRPCAGLVAPGTCLEQRMEVRSSMFGASAGWTFFLAKSARTEIAVTPELSVSMASVRYTGTVSGETIDGSKMLVGPGATLMFTTRPVKKFPLGVAFAVRVRALSPVGGDMCVDCFQAFQQSIAEARLQAGLSYIIPEQH